MGEKSVFIALQLLLVFNCLIYSASTFLKINRGNCTEDELLCDGNKCIAKHKQCNSQADCADGEDEYFCECIQLGFVPCNNGKDCISVEDICGGKSKRCPDYEVDCSAWVTESANPIDNSTEAVEIFDDVRLFREDCDAMGYILCENGTTCITAESACKGKVENCEYDCSMLTTTTVDVESASGFMSTTISVDHEIITDKIETFATHNSPVPEIIMETTPPTIDVETTTVIQQIDNTSVMVNHTEQIKPLTLPLPTVEPEPEPQPDANHIDDSKNKTEILESEKEITKTEISKVSSIEVKTQTEDAETTKDASKVEFGNIVTNSTAKGNATTAYDAVNAASQTSTTDKEKGINIFVPIGIGAFVAVAILVAIGSICVRRKRKSATYKCDHYS